MGKIRYGICTGLDNLKLVEQLGYDYIEPSVTSVMKYDDDELKNIKEKLQNSKISCEVFNILFPKTMKLIGSDMDIAELSSYVDKACSRVEELGGKIIVFGSGKCRKCDEEQDFLQAYKQLIEVFQITAEVAARHGIKIVIEPLNRNETNMINTIKEGAALRADAARDNLGLLADYFHVAADKDHLEDMLVIKDFWHIHIAAESGRKYPLPSETENYPELFKMLAKIQYDQRISIEGKTDCIEKDGKTALTYLKELEAEAYGNC